MSASSANGSAMQDADSSSNNDESDYLLTYQQPLASNQHWVDIQPTISPDDIQHSTQPSFVSIIYNSNYSECIAYLRSVMHVKEYSYRALALTQYIIQLNGAYYTAWYYRRQVLYSLNSTELYHTELQWCNTLAEESPKSYQLWQHRRAVLQRVMENDSSASSYNLTAELDTTSSVLQSDSKNYHVWSYRQWLLDAFRGHHSLQQHDELLYVTMLLEEDVRNNSAWNQRFYAVLTQNELQLTDVAVQLELEYAFSKIQLAPNNDSPYNYVLGLLNYVNQQHCDEPSSELNPSNHIQHVIDQCERVIQKQHQSQSGATQHPADDQEHAGCANASALLVDCYEMLQQYGHAVQHCALLASTLDVVRERYWNYRTSSLQLAEAEAG